MFSMYTIYENNHLFEVTGLQFLPVTYCSSIVMWRFCDCTDVVLHVSRFIWLLTYWTQHCSAIYYLWNGLRDVL